MKTNERNEYPFTIATTNLFGAQLNVFANLAMVAAQKNLNENRLS